MNRNEQEWDKQTTPKFDISKEKQCALDWWHKLPVQNLIDMNNSWVGYLWKYYPGKSHPYHLTSKEVYHIYKHEHIK